MKQEFLIHENEPRILILNEKHGDSYFIVNSEKELHEICVQILKQRLIHGFYTVYMAINRSGFNSLEEIEKLPDGDVKQFAKEMWERYCNNLKLQKEDEYFVNEVQEAIIYCFNPYDKFWMRNQAYELLVQRENHEYEGIKLEYPSKEYKY